MTRRRTLLIIVLLFFAALVGGSLLAITPPDCFSVFLTDADRTDTPVDTLFMVRQTPECIEAFGPGTYRYIWDFGHFGGDEHLVTTTDPNIEHTFPDSGKYTVSLLVFGSDDAPGYPEQPCGDFCPFSQTKVIDTGQLIEFVGIPPPAPEPDPCADQTDLSSCDTTPPPPGPGPSGDGDGDTGDGDGGGDGTVGGIPIVAIIIIVGGIVAGIVVWRRGKLF